MAYMVADIVWPKEFWPGSITYNPGPDKPRLAKEGQWWWCIGRGTPIGCGRTPKEAFNQWLILTTMGSGR